MSCFGYEYKEKYQIYLSKNTFKKNMNLLLIGEERKRHYVVIKDFITFMYNNHTLHRGRKHFCRYCFEAFSTAEC